ncbi:MAG: hypothetical protein M3345_00035 [Actinomycetota bacterium]|nr:hypothetical protein [Actinomycetota bacterium]
MPFSNEFFLRRILSKEAPVKPTDEDEFDDEVSRLADDIRRDIGRLIPEAARVLREHSRQHKNP